MDLIWFPIIELTIIAGGVIAVLIVGPDRALRRREQAQELAEIDAWLETIRATSPMREH
jgi:hypothetical protein